MRRALASILLATSLAAGADYRLVLADGKVLAIDSAPEIRGDTALFTRDGMSFSLPLTRLDLQATEAANRRPPETPARDPRAKTANTAPPAPADRSRRFTDEDLKGLAPSPPGDLSPGAPVGTATKTMESTSKADAASLARWSELSRKRVNLEARRGALEEKIRELDEGRAALEAENDRRQRDYGQLPTDPYAVAASQDWTKEYWQRRETLSEKRSTLAAQEAELEEDLRGIDRDMRDLSLSPGVGRNP